MEEYKRQCNYICTMADILDSRQNKVIKIGNSLGFRVKKFYLELAGMAEKDQEVTEALIRSKHGIFVGHYLPKEQPDLEDIPGEKLEKILENKQGE